MKRWTTVLLIGLATGAQAQDAGRGARLFDDTRSVTGADVAACKACHADASALRAMLANRGVRTDDAKQLARWLQAVIDGAQPGAANAKAQYRGVLKAQDVRDLAAYIAAARRT